METNYKNAIAEALVVLKLSGDSLVDNLREILHKQNKLDVSDQELETVLENQLNIKFEKIEDYEPAADVLRLLPAISARHYGVMPLALSGRLLRVAMVDPTDFGLLADLRLITGHYIRPVVAHRRNIENMIESYYRNTTSSGRGGFSAVNHNTPKAGSSTAISKTGEAPVIKLVNDIISEAIHQGASDIHFEPFEREMRVRFRQDGVLQLHRTIHTRAISEVTSRVKIMANMDIAEKRRPQDGRIRMENKEKSIDMRISTLPTEHGEKIVLRILDKGNVELNLASLGMDRKDLETLNTIIKKPFGMVLVTGPTGSGKTTTLYSALQAIKTPDINISTIEDPIEYKLDGITQTAVKTDINLTFANALRTLLRQDPNVIMVGEIRDEETAQMAIRASLTGHLVFSTLHTNDAPSAISRLLDMQIEPFLVSSSLTLVVAQRLVRKICSGCAVQEAVEPIILKGLGLQNTESGHSFKKGKGCPKCNFTGFAGRIGLFECMPITESIQTLINQKADSGKIRQMAMSQGMITLRQDGINKAKAGLTTPEEVLRETN